MPMELEWAFQTHRVRMKKLVRSLLIFYLTASVYPTLVFG